MAPAEILVRWDRDEFELVHATLPIIFLPNDGSAGEDYGRTTFRVSARVG